MEPRSHDAGRTGRRLPTWALVAVGLIAGALVPAVVAIALFVSLAVHRPLLGRTAPGRSALTATRITVAWALSLVAIAAVQAAGVVLGIGAITSPAGLAVRTGFALAVQALLLVATKIYLANVHTRQIQRLNPTGRSNGSTSSRVV